jgi:hypothetical protein
MPRYPTALIGALLLGTGASATAETLNSAEPTPAAKVNPQHSHRTWAPHWTAPHPSAVTDYRINQRRQEVEAAREQRELELAAARKAREADRAAWLERWDEQRQRAREASLEREQRYRDELSRRFPGLRAYRLRYADELERRWEEIERRRRERWHQTDLPPSP